MTDALTAMLPLLWSAGSVVIGLCLWGLAQRHHAAIPPERAGFRVHFYGRVLPLVAPVAALILIVVGKSVFLHRDIAIDAADMRMTTGAVMAWLTIAAVYAVTRDRSKTLFAAIVIVPYTLMSLTGIADEAAAILSGIGINLGSIRISALGFIQFSIAAVVLAWIARAAINTVAYGLSHVPDMRPSTRQLLTTLSGSVIYIIAFLGALGVLGIDLTAFAIFGGALGVGIGFGLQKIASNFISGIILLLERSIAVNDLIEFPNGNVQGIVKHTGPRYTLIETFENREIMIPNEDFMTQSVVNWTFSDTRGLLRLPLYVAYGSDLEQAQQIAADVAAAHPRVMQTPPPSCLLHGFTDTAVVLTLFVSIRDVREKRLTTQSEILMSIWNAFRTNGIGIPHQARETRIGPKESGRA